MLDAEVADVHDVLISPPAERNKQPILEVLERVLPAAGTVLEVASGTGQHIVHFAAALPALQWIPSDPDARHRASIVAHIRESGVGNVAEPLDLDVLKRWQVARVDAVIVANLLHIAPRAVLPALCRGAASVLPADGVLHVYGPFRQEGKHTADSNARFDDWLRAQDPDWGVRDLEEVIETAREQGLEMQESIEMPANNLSLVLRRTA